MSVVFVTMVYDDAVFLDIWVRYYSRHTDRSNLHIITHGEQPYAHEIGKGCHVFPIARDPLNPRLDQDRFTFINKYCADLTADHDRVIYNDVDEIVVLDPAFGNNLVGHIEGLPKEHRVVTPLGLEIIHRKDVEGDFDHFRLILDQRRFVRLNSWYTKPCITNTPVIWGPDGHGSSHGEIHLDDHLYLFHLKWFDTQFHFERHRARLKLRFRNDADEEVIIGAGSWSWSEIEYLQIANSFLSLSFDRQGQGFDFGRHRRRIVGSFAGNSRGMFKIDWFVDGDLREIPERFVGMF